MTCLLVVGAILALQDTPTPKEEPKKLVESPLRMETELGYRAIPLQKGDFATYRSLVNLGEGPRLLNGTVTYEGKTRLLLTGSGLGDPFHTLRASAFREGMYEATVQSRSFLYYNFLPSFGNALLDRGILTPQRAYDVNRGWIDTELKLRPGRAIIPYFAYTRDRGNGTGIVNWVANGNEYPLFNVMADHTNRYRGGVRVEKQRYHLSFEQGGTQYNENQLSSTRQRTFGTRLTPALGQALVLNEGEQLYSVNGNSLFTSAAASGSIGEWAQLTGQFLYVRPKLDTNLMQRGTGNFLVPGTATFLTTQMENLTGQASMPRSSGIYTVNLNPLRRFHILHSLWTDRYHTAGALAISDLVAPARSSTFQDRLEFTYNREQTEALVDVTSKVTLRGGHRYTWGTALLRGPLVTPTSAPNPEMKLHTVLAGAMIRNWKGLFLNADFERGNASRVYFRTSLNDFSKGSLRARYRLNNAWQLGWNTVILDNQSPETSLDFRHQQNSVSLQWTPKSQRTSILADYTRSTVRSTIPYLIPSTLGREISRYRDDANTASLMMDLQGPKWKAGASRLTLGGAYVQTAGSRPSRFPQPEARVYIPMHAKVSMFADWRYWGYGQPLYRYEAFRAHQLTVGLRLSR
jgi:hypothetical protein